MATGGEVGMTNWFEDFQHGWPYIQNSKLNQGHVLQAFSLRAWGNMALHTGDDPVQVKQHRADFLQCFQLETGSLITGEQVHGDHIQVVTRAERGKTIAVTDGLITREKGVVLGVLVADCLPIFIYDPKTPAVGIVHAGWRGTVQSVAQKAILAMVNAFQTKPEETEVAIGPGIRACCFVTQADVATQFQSNFSEAVREDCQRFYLDLAAVNRKMLQSSGVKTERISEASFCTCCQPERFFSYRASQGTMGRMMGIIALR
jgi:YfiH family protein